jgi:hypothetical protein
MIGWMRIGQKRRVYTYDGGRYCGVEQNRITEGRIG